MQSDENSFCGYVVLDSFNMVNIDEDRFSEQKYEERIFMDLYYEDFKYVKWMRICILG